MTETPNYDDSFDAIVVGGGLAGSSAAITLAQRGYDPIVIERGDTPGAKNVFGGVMYTPTIRDLVDIDDAPKERYVAQKAYSLLSEEGDETRLTMQPHDWREPPHNDSWMVLRRDFDEWFAQQAVEAGATLITDTTVTDLIVEGGQIVGVETDRPDGDLRAPAVVLAEGANSLVSEAAGLKEPDARDDVAVSVKEVRTYDRETIEERFNLDGEAGAAYHYFGDGACGDTVGGGFLYTNKRTIALGVVYRIADANDDETGPEAVLNRFKSHPAVAPLIEGGRMVEYAAHAVPEGGPDAVPDLVHDGAVIAGDAASLVLNSGLHLEGTNMATESGHLAGRAIADALDQGRTDAAALQPYADALAESYVMENLEEYGWAMEAAADEREFVFDDLPRAVASASAEYFRVDRVPKADHLKAAKQRILHATGGYTGAIRKAWKFRKMFY
ncbi:FAD-dependent oxidoreductase [Halococcoides cellulosivorans]|uniref:FAD-dependent oxidoreductase n=1 Tax=Halococcoides cellulosivorans TaxID=1679096 RepID=A0A2R4WXI6_9EURY|nr:FAD-dependent oxidoreductase [Halococcoides cellulosivorans]AWB26248.1 FAD-dependent oxidoreductase [Halococcoides cellulosivorans]